MRRKIDFDKSDGLCGTLFPPRSDWKPPTSFPNLHGQSYLGLDIETKDPKLKESGPGFIRGDAEVTGISFATTDKSWYFPMRHLGGGNMDVEPVLRFTRDILENHTGFIVGANLQYELEGLWSEDIKIIGKLIDVQVAEALIDEECPDGYSLEAICKKRLGQGKDETLLKEACSSFGFKDVKASLWKLPSQYVGPYAEFDAFSVLKIFDKQKKELEAQGLLEIFQLESEVLPILWEMRKQGIPVDVDRAQQVSAEFKKDEEQKEYDLMKECGFFVDVNSPDSLKKVFTKFELKYPTTDKGNPSFTGEFLSAFAHPTINKIAQIRELKHMRSYFIDEWIMGNQIKGRVHPQWKQLASDDGGTRTGRMACANPNAQQVPAAQYRTSGKTNPYGKAIRSLFISDTGTWGKFDYKQQEPRILTHFANLCKFVGAPLAAMAYRTNKQMDFYKYIVDSAGIDRRVAKDMYLGLCYGMGINKLCKKLGKPRDEGERIINDFNEKVPFIKEIAESCERNAQTRGYVKTLLGRKRHFNRWEPFDSWKRGQAGEFITACDLKRAQEIWPKTKLVRADTRKALNALIQGSAADMVKAALLQIHKQLGTVPFMAVHDELDIGIKDEKHAQQCLEIIENCVEMSVPIYSDMKIGTSWT